MLHTRESIVSRPNVRRLIASCRATKILFAIGLGLISAIAVAEETPAPDPNDARMTIRDGETQIVDAFKDPDYWIRHDLWVETASDSDGDGQKDRMHVAVTRPSQTRDAGLKVPVIYITSPYFAGTGTNDRDYFWNPRQELGEPPKKRNIPSPTELESRRPIISKRHVNDWVPRGFAVVHSSSPGTGLSQGCPTIGGANETDAPKSVIDWLCGRGNGFSEPVGGQTVTADWCDGNVGMTGTSYNGTLPLAAATTGVEGLRAIVPVAPNTSYYHYYRSNGLVRHPGGYLGEDIDVLYDYVHSGNEPRREFCDCEIREQTFLQNLDRTHGDFNDFWASRDYVPQLGGVRAAVLIAHAFNDWNVVPEHSTRVIERLKQTDVPLQIYYHQGGHGGPPPLRMINRWFTRYVVGESNGVEEDAKVWIVREGDPRDKPTAYEDYPHPESEFVTLHPVGDAPRRGQLSLRDDQSNGSETIIDNFSFDGAALASAEWTEHRLMFITDELKRPLHLSGTPSVDIRLACDQPAANLSVWLVSLPWDDSDDALITDNIITRGWADPQNRDSLRQSKPLEPGQFYDLQFDLQPDDQIVAAGQKLGWMIFSSDKDFTLHPDPGTRLTIDLSGTRLHLPVVGGEPSFRKCFVEPPKTDADQKETDQERTDQETDQETDQTDASDAVDGHPRESGSSG